MAFDRKNIRTQINENVYLANCSQKWVVECFYAIKARGEKTDQ